MPKPNLVFMPERDKSLSAYSFSDRRRVRRHEVFYKGLLSRGELCVWLGREKHRKSNFLLQFAICAATGRDFIGMPFAASQPLQIVMLDFESKTSSLHKRTEGIKNALHLTPYEIEILEENLQIIEIRRMLDETGKLLPRFSHLPKNNSWWSDLVQEYDPDLWIVDPMRCFHNADENDSGMEHLLMEIRHVFRPAAFIASHHMRKIDKDVPLRNDFRVWSEAARGSSAIKAHCDVIVGQERSIDKVGNEIVDFSGYCKDGSDVGPFRLLESGYLSFFWEPLMSEINKNVKKALSVLGKSAWSRSAAAQQVMEQLECSSATAYRHLAELQRLDLLKCENGLLCTNRERARVNPHPPDTPKT